MSEAEPVSFCSWACRTPATHRVTDQRGEVWLDCSEHALVDARAGRKVDRLEVAS